MLMFMLYIPYTWYETVICTCKCEVFGLSRPFQNEGSALQACVLICLVYVNICFKSRSYFVFEAVV